MKVLSFLKLKYSVSNSNDEDFFNDINSKMDFSDLGLRLSKDIVEKNDMMREHFKLLMNCGLGKFAQKSRRTKTIFVKDQVTIKNNLLF